MNRLERALDRALEVLEGAGAGYALVGGLAVSVRAEPRFTRDVDLAVVCRDDAAAEAVVRRFVAHGFEIDTLVEQEAVARLATARLRPPGGAAGGVVVDLLFASSGLEPEIVAGSEDLEVFPGRRVPVAGVGPLVAVKLLSRDDVNRPQDSADLRALLGGASESELSEVEGLLTLIDERGFSRGRDLNAIWRRTRKAHGV